MLIPMLAAAAAAYPPPCAAPALQSRLDGISANFNGMSHSGTWLALTNRGRRACAISARPRVVMLGERGRVLPIVRRSQPAVPRVTLAPGTTVRTGLRWVSGDVYDRSRCYDVRSLQVARATLPLTAHICGSAGKPATFEQSPLSSR